MTYANAQATAQRLIAAKGFAATIRGEATPTDPVTGLGGGDGADRTVNAVRLNADIRAFGEALSQQATCMLLCDGPVLEGEFWLDEGNPRPIIALMPLSPDNATHILTKVLIGA